MKYRPLATGYSAEFDTINEHNWYEIIDCFDDSNIYQTWSYDATRHGEKNLSHFILKSSSQIVAAAQARIVKLPLVGIGAAYVRWAPLWRLRNQKTESIVFQMAIRALRNEYVCRRGLILRIYPVLFDKEHSLFKDILLSEGYHASPGEAPQRTLMLDIQPDIKEIRKNFDQKWRNCLNKAEKNSLEMKTGYDEALFEEFIGIYKELLNRKKFAEPNDINEFKKIQISLPEKFKMKIFLSSTNGSSSSGAVCTAIGNMGLYLFGATNETGMKNSGSYLIQWKIIQWLKQKGCKYYNLNGINPKKNPGSFHFKAGISGKNGNDIHYLGRFDSFEGSFSATITYKVNRTVNFIKTKVSKFLFNR